VPGYLRKMKYLSPCFFFHSKTVLLNFTGKMYALFCDLEKNVLIVTIGGLLIGRNVILLGKTKFLRSKDGWNLSFEKENGAHLSKEGV
jgi:hypothetical protein